MAMTQLSFPRLCEQGIPQEGEDGTWIGGAVYCASLPLIPLFFVQCKITAWQLNQIKNV
jgi:hypothetical protein